MISRTSAILLAFAATTSSGVALADAKDACLDASVRGQVARRDGKLRDARALFLACADASCPQLVRQDCSSWLEEIDRRVPSVVLVVRDEAGRDVEGARVSVDGEPLAARIEGRETMVDPGAHTFHFEASDQSADEKVVVTEGEKLRRIAVTLHRTRRSDVVAPSEPSPSRPVPTMTWILGGVAALAGSGFFWFSAVGDARDLRDACDAGCAHADASPARTKAAVADVLLGVSLAAAAGAVVVWMLDARGAKTTARGAW